MGVGFSFFSSQSQDSLESDDDSEGSFEYIARTPIQEPDYSSIRTDKEAMNSVTCVICKKKTRAESAFYRHFDNLESTFCSMACVKTKVKSPDDSKFVLCKYPESMITKYKFLNRQDLTED